MFTLRGQGQDEEIAYNDQNQEKDEFFFRFSRNS